MLEYADAIALAYTRSRHTDRDVERCLPSAIGHHMVGKTQCGPHEAMQGVTGKRLKRMSNRVEQRHGVGLQSTPVVD